MWVYVFTYFPLFLHEIPDDFFHPSHFPKSYLESLWFDDFLSSQDLTREITFLSMKLGRLIQTASNHNSTDESYVHPYHVARAISCPLHTMPEPSDGQYGVWRGDSMLCDSLFVLLFLWVRKALTTSYSCTNAQSWCEEIEQELLLIQELTAAVVTYTSLAQDQAS